MRYFILIPIFLTTLLASEPDYTNHLIDEPSPYLQQHAHNPVDWYPWGEEAFEKAKREHKPIFLSIGYSTCHWCHVMAHESFEDPKIAEIIDRWFVPVKVDREEMPHLDKYFQKVYALLHRRSGGWPLTILLTEDLKPFFAATYIPPVDSYGVEGLETLLPKMGRLYRNNRMKIDQRADAIEALMRRVQNLPSKPIDADLKIADKAIEAMHGYYDPLYKGFGDRPKFPESSRLRLLLDIYRLNGNERARTMALETLDAMQRSGLYDQIDGAFFRYCVDRRWRMPHFEKMLYTNAELIPLYLQAWKMTGKERYKEVVKETISEIDRRFRTQEGLYFSASDADSDHQEGGYFIYRYDEALEALKRAGYDEMHAKMILKFFDIEEDGNFDTEFSHPRRAAEREPEGFEKAKKVLGAMRNGRTYPFIDKKVITAWNAMMIKALFVASGLDDRYMAEAKRSYAALKHLMQQNDGSLYHQVLFGNRPEQGGLLEDYAFLIDAALTAYQMTLEEAYLNDADRWTKIALKMFYREGRWLLGSDGFESYADLQDNYYTSSLSVMLDNLLDLALLESSLSYETAVKKTLDANGAVITKRPDAYPEALRAYLRLKRGIVGIKSSRATLLANARKIEAVGYPFLLKKAEELHIFIACDMRTCFAFGEDFESIKESIESR
ncbi:thioredoxin domain-containing protein [Hydrogenimonas cancrithermarum]|uniref:Spermatogenesis-associated protein 20-like TRX domain-containing protein n=1 Tax=Hydrogenimonas cancrithermarum TaxID=2993563 RepID=A0ABN6WZD6_9BACT|nr:thioredoxin domain-containing protein [Hydrogenimonas cancrithermarum]BDY13769.1 hypothetical protein HCR_20810 [Hydrogenimonas cancrithermarum]